ncbi:MAG: GNAT family N-acetyltransferase [Anaerolineales bacterium]|nr:GNAT family N-acetyltransferase [Anaerolineales bacterium]
MNPHIAVRPAEITDAAELARLNVAFNGGSEPAAALAQRLQDPRRVETPLLAEVAGRVVGFAAVRVVPSVFYPEPRAELTELYVEPEYRRLGVARALVAEAEILARQLSANSLVVLTGDDNAPALKLYQALGFELDDVSLSKHLSESNE